jgi:hypothetical protein
MDPTENQKQVLKSLALKGPNNIQRIQISEKMHYPTVYNSVKKLAKAELVWLSGIQDRGPKSAKEYSLTPLGILATVVHCDVSKKMNRILVNWRDLVPKFILKWEEIERLDLIEDIFEIMRKIYLDFMNLIDVSKSEYDEKLIKNNKDILIVRRNSLDLHFLTVAFEKFKKRDNNNSKIENLVDMISNDSSYHEIWDRWFSLQTFHYNYLLSIDQKIKESNNRKLKS